MDAYHILVIILASVLALNLILMSIVVSVLIKIVKDVRHITEKAAGAADNIEHAAQLFKNTTSVAAVTKVIGNAIDMFARHGGKKGKD